MTWRMLIGWLSMLFALSGRKASDLPVITDGMTRRGFLRALGVSAGALATAGFDLDVPLVLDEPLPGAVFDMAQFDSLFKEAYAPAIIAMLNQESPFLRLLK